MTAIACARCGDPDGPFVRTDEGHVCEDCLDGSDQ